MKDFLTLTAFLVLIFWNYHLSNLNEQNYQRDVDRFIQLKEKLERLSTRVELMDVDYSNALVESAVLLQNINDKIKWTNKQT